MGIDLLKELMETQINIEADNMDIDDIDDMDILKQNFIKSTYTEGHGQGQGQAGGRRRRKIRRLKSYK